jgi:hypothetical protein
MSEHMKLKDQKVQQLCAPHGASYGLQRWT